MIFELFDPKAEYVVWEGCNLPHWYQPGVTYFVTFRTEDSIPVQLAGQWHRRRDTWLRKHGIDSRGRGWKDEVGRLPRDEQREFHETFSRDVLEYLDRGYGACVLRSSELSSIVADSLLHFDGDRYVMGDFVVMPNHVHLLVGLQGDTEIEAQCKSWKKFTAREINRRLGQKGRFWQEESFDHLVRSPEQFEAIQRYIADNPRRAGLREGEFYYWKRPQQRR
jgi:REP-associated tyrosine transposase